MKFLFSRVFVFLRTLISLSLTQIIFRLFYVILRKFLIFLKFKPLKSDKLNSSLIINNQYRPN